MFKAIVGISTVIAAVLPPNSQHDLQLPWLSRSDWLWRIALVKAVLLIHSTPRFAIAESRSAASRSRYRWQRAKPNGRAWDAAGRAHCLNGTLEELERSGKTTLRKRNIYLD